MSIAKNSKQTITIAIIMPLFSPSLWEAIAPFSSDDVFDVGFGVPLPGNVMVTIGIDDVFVLTIDVGLAVVLVVIAVLSFFVVFNAFVALEVVCVAAVVSNGCIDVLIVESCTDDCVFAFFVINDKCTVAETFFVVICVVDPVASGAIVV